MNYIGVILAFSGLAAWNRVSRVFMALMFLPQTFVKPTFYFILFHSKSSENDSTREELHRRSRVHLPREEEGHR